jgi:hypothetical protein
MKTKWGWNQSFEDLMNSLNEWVKDKDKIQVVHLDWKYVHPTGKNQGYWYYMMMYKE